MKSRRKIIFATLSIIVIALAISLTLIRLTAPKNKSLSKLISPLPEEATIANHEESPKSISYYIITSQGFLNKARSLATDSEQTPAEKQAIIETINQALDLANQAIAVYPHDDRGFFQRAMIYSALTPFLPEAANFAIQDLKETLRLNQQNPLYYQQLANLYLGKSDFENAALAFYNFHLLNPTDLQALYNLADSLEKSGQLVKAKHYFEKLIGLLPAENKNLSVIKARREEIVSLLAKAKLQYLKEPGENQNLTPNLPLNSTEKIIGTQELPIEQAVLSQKVIIASGQSLSDSNNEQSADWQINAKTGEGIIAAGQTEVTVYNKNVANNKQIVVSPLGENQNKVVYLLAKKEQEWFKIGVDSPADFNIRFKWWIINE